MKRYVRKFEEGNYPSTVDTFRIDKVIDSDNGATAFGHITMQKPHRAPSVWTETYPIRELHALYDMLEEICEKEIKKFNAKHR